MKTKKKNPIKGLYKNNGIYYYSPSTQGLSKNTKRPNPISLKTKDFDEALQKVIDLKGIDFQTQGRGIAEWFEVYLADRKKGNHYAPSVLPNVTRMVKKFIEFVGPNTTPESIGKGNAMDWYNELNDGSREPISCQGYIRYTKAFFSWLLDKEIIKVNPFFRMKMPVAAATRIAEFWTAKERDKILKVAAKSKIQRRDETYFVLMMGFYAGMRIKEILNTKWKWFNIKGNKGSITIQNEAEKGFKTKNRKIRTVPMPTVLFKYIKSLDWGEDDEYVLFPEKGDQLHRANGHRWDGRDSFNRVLKEANTEGGFHKMRHSYAHLRINAKVPETKIRKWMGITRDVYEKHYAGVSEFDDDADLI